MPVLRCLHEGALDAWHNAARRTSQIGNIMNRVIYIVGLIVVILAVLSFFGLR